MKNYRADYECIIDGERYNPDSDYFSAENDEEAIEIAKSIAADGIDYADVGHIDIELTYVAELDEDYEELRTIYY